MSVHSQDTVTVIPTSGMNFLQPSSSATAAIFLVSSVLVSATSSDKEMEEFSASVASATSASLAAAALAAARAFAFARAFALAMAFALATAFALAMALARALRAARALRLAARWRAS